MSKKYLSLGLVFFGLLLSNCGRQNDSSASSTTTADTPLTIWWNQNYYIQEDEALNNLLAEWQEKTGQEAQLIFISQDDILKDAEKALAAGNPPDILFSARADETLIPRWAWDGELVEVTDLVEDRPTPYSDSAKQSAYLYNKAAQKRAAYAVPVQQRTLHIHYWRDLLEQAGFSDADIPTEWDAFWAFWQTVQERLRSQGQDNLYGLGLPMSSEAGDTYSMFEQVLMAYDIELMDAEGNLRVNEPEVRQGIIAALTWYTNFYQAGFVSPDAHNWGDGDNNVAFLNRNLVMTINPTLSIPGSQRENESLYQEKIATIRFPNEPDGEAAKYFVAVRQAVIFKKANNPEIAEEFLDYLLQPENISTYLEESFGRYFPVMPQLTEQPFWNNPDDPHISVANQQFKAKANRPHYQVSNPAYSTVQLENVWGRAIERVLLDGVTPTMAVDDAIARINEIFATWER